MNIAENLERIRGQIHATCERAGRPADSVTLLTVSKGHPPATVQEAAASGLMLFGENRVQEAKTKIPQCPGRLRWHLIGHLQTNKCRDAVSLFEMIHSVDSLHLAQEIQKCAEKAAKTMPVLLEVNVAGEASKFGYQPETLLTELDSLNSLTRLEIHGLMTVAPWSQDAERVRPVFLRLRELKQQCEQKLGAPLPHLSMGMSGDFGVAIEEGATIVRIGSALLGERVKVRSEQDE